MNIKLKKGLTCFIASMLSLVVVASASAQDFEFSNPQDQTQRSSNNQTQSVDTEAFKQRAKEAFEQQMRALGNAPQYSTAGIGDFFKPGLDKLVGVIDKVIPEDIKPYIPELPDLKLGRKPKLLEIVPPAVQQFLRDAAKVYTDLQADSRNDLDNLKAAIERKDGKEAARILAKLAYKHNTLARRLRAARALGMRSVTISVSGGVAYFVGADGTHGIAIDIDSILNPESEIKASWYATVAVSGGAQVGGSVSLNLGFTPSTYDDLKGLSYEGRLSGSFVAGVGVAVTYDPVNNKFLGVTLSAVTGAEVEASFAMGHTEVIKTFVVPAVLPNPGDGGGGSGGGGGGGGRPSPSPEQPKTLGIYSTMIHVSNYRRSGERVDRVSPGSAAARAGLEVGDIIISVNSQGISSANSLRQAIASSGSTMQMQVVNVRDGQVVNVTVRF